jgi:hypothetical protein
LGRAVAARAVLAAVFAASFAVFVNSRREFDDFVRGQFAHEFRDLVSVVFRRRCEKIEWRQAKAFGQTRNGLDRNGR